MGVPEMTALASTAKVAPAVNQIELHPWLQWRHVTDYCRDNGIVLEVCCFVSGGACGRLKPAKCCNLQLMLQQRKAHMF